MNAESVAGGAAANQKKAKQDDWLRWPGTDFEEMRVDSSHPLPLLSSEFWEEERKRRSVNGDEYRQQHWHSTLSVKFWRSSRAMLLRPHSSTT